MVRLENQINNDADKFGGIQLLDNEVLTTVARGELDLNQIAINHLAGRGLDAKSKLRLLFISI